MTVWYICFFLDVNQNRCGEGKIAYVSFERLACADLDNGTTL